jgi:conjugative relaxase-like TrwC/TraI family protein
VTCGADTVFTAVPPRLGGLGWHLATLPIGADEAGGPPSQVLRTTGHPLDWRELDPGRLASYWTAKVASGIEDYYAGEGESPGEWYGRGASALGLHGEIDPDDLTAVLKSEYGELKTMSRRVGPGHSPYSGGTTTVRRRPGWDFCFRAPKSVSLIYAFGDPRARKEVVAAHDAAVRAVLDYAERHLVKTRRSVDGVRQQVKGEGLIVALFRHRVSRAGDPLLHTHALVVNATRDDRGRWLRLNAPQLLGPAKTLSYLYQAKLRRELSRRLGVEWEPVRNGLADVKGIRREAIETFSRRRQEILELLDARGQDPEQAGAAQQAAYETRRAKESSLAPRELREEWERYADHVGLGRVDVERALHRVRCPERVPPSELRRIARELAEGQGLVQESASATEQEIVGAICERLPLGADVEAIERCAELVATSPELVRLDPPERPERLTELRPEGARYTTRGLLAAEREVIEVAVNGREAGVAVAPARDLERVLAKAHWSILRPVQERMVRALARGGDCLSVVRGDAGTGKTFALGAYGEVVAEAHWRVIGAASTRRAAAELEAVGIPSTSIAATLAGIKRRRLPLRTVLIVDEAGTATTWEIRALLREVVQANGKLVLVGDPRQLGAIGPGGVFRALLDRLDAIKLTEVVRQELAVDREAIEAQKEGRFGEALGIYAEGGRVAVCESPFLTRAAVVEGWARDGDPERTLMLARSRREVSYLNHAARARLEVAGRLQGPVIEVPGEPFQAGDLIVTRARAYGIGVRNQDRWRVLSVDPEERTMEVERLTDGHRARLERTYLESKGWRDVPAIEHGYAGTVAIAQGATVDRVHVLADGGLDAREIYTATTRSRAETRLYLTDARVRERSSIQPEPQREIDDPYHDVLWAVDLTRPEFASEQERRRQEARRMADSELRERIRALRDVESQPLSSAIEGRRAELAALTEEIALRTRAEVAAARRLRPAWVESSIGPMPDNATQRSHWERGLRDLVAYRRRFGISDPERGLGGPPRSREEQAARDQAELAIRAVERARAIAERSQTRVAERGIEISL